MKRLAVVAIKRKSLPAAVADSMRDEILEGRWKQKIPGMRVLRDEYDVSMHTMSKALQQLEKEGLIVAPQPGMPRVLNAEMVAALQQEDRGATGPVAAVIAWQQEAELTETDAAICSEIRKLLATHGYRHKHLLFRDITRSRGAKHLQALITQNPAECLPCAWSKSGV